MSLTTRLLFLLLIPPIVAGCGHSMHAQIPGKLPDGRILLPNGWMLSPAGEQVEVGELPLTMAISPDGRYVITTDDGTAVQDLTVVDVATWTVVQRLPVAKAWVGLKLFDGGRRLLVSGGNDNRVNVYEFSSGRLRFADSLVIPLRRPDANVWVAGVDIDERAGLVYAAGKESRTLTTIGLGARTVVKTLDLPATPYTC
ncbi:MAG TPA: hypothetical protein VML00_09900, partial [Bacteroidota bacterium]|nr:hypothetical protein [Bacteroidota bacterium]